MSSASIWEVAVKVRIGKLVADPRALVAAIGGGGFMELPISAAHAAGVSNLSLHHTDPFDRLLIAQAVSEPLHLLTADKLLVKYSELVVLV